MTKEELLKELIIANEYIFASETLQLEYEKNELEIAEMEKKQKDLEKGSGMIGAVLGFAAAFVSFVTLKDKEFIWALVSILPSYFVCGIIVELISGLFLDERRKNKAQIYYNEIGIPLIYRKKDIEDKVNKLLDSEEMKKAQNLIPSEYFDGESIKRIISYVNNGRADTLKEAFNLYENELHNIRMEQMQQEQIQLATQTLEEQKNQTKVATAQTEAMKKQYTLNQEILKRTKSTARAAKVTAFLTLVKK